jgi:predicted nicotinamide N-methyase
MAEQETTQEAKFVEPSWRRAAMSQSQRFQERVTLNFEHGVVVHATQNINSGSCLWDAALVLASHLSNSAVYPAGSWHGKKVCEIGAGCGVTGIVVAQLGADVILTELEDELVLLSKNVADNPINTSPFASEIGESHTGSAKPMEYFWGSDPSHLEGPFDVILAADCVYELQLFEMLVKALIDITGPKTKTFFCIEHRWSDVEKWWWQEVKKHFNVRLVPQEQHGQYQHPKIDIYELTRRVRIIAQPS